MLIFKVSEWSILGLGTLVIVRTGRDARERDEALAGVSPPPSLKRLGIAHGTTAGMSRRFPMPVDRGTGWT